MGRSVLSLDGDCRGGTWAEHMAISFHLHFMEYPQPDPFQLTWISSYAGIESPRETLSNDVIAAP